MIRPKESGRAEVREFCRTSLDVYRPLVRELCPNYLREPVQSWENLIALAAVPGIRSVPGFRKILYLEAYSLQFDKVRQRGSGTISHHAIANFAAMLPERINEVRNEPVVHALRKLIPSGPIEGPDVLAKVKTWSALNRSGVLLPARSTAELSILVDQLEQDGDTGDVLDGLAGDV